jgi:ubiquinone/menaquinone biosynthesis C-methylase UbiE
VKRIKDGYLDKIREKVDLTGKDILEVGCGNGSRSIKIAEYCKSLTAIEPEETLVELAKENNSKSNIKYSVGIAENLIFADNAFNIVIFTLSFHHVPENKMTQAIDEAVRVSTKDGLIMFLEPAFNGSFFESEIMFDACDGDERRNKALAYVTMLSHKKLREISEFEDETVFSFDGKDDFIQSLNPKKNIDRIEKFLSDNNMELAAQRRINIFQVIK